MASPPVAEIIKCPNCSAPLEPPLGGGVVFCTYCGSQVNVRPQAHAPHAPRQFEPDPVSPQSTAVPVLWIVGLLLVGVAIVAVSLFSVQTRLATVAVATDREFVASRLKEVGMDRTLSQLSTWAGVKPTTDTLLDLKLKGSRFETVAFHWPEPNAPNITQVTLSARTAIVQGDPMLATASSVFGAKFVKHPQGGYAYESNGVSFSVNDRQDRQVEIRVFPERHPSWARQMAVLWQVLRALVLQEPVKLDTATRRDLLGTGYSLRALLQVDPSVDVDQSQSHVAQHFPGISGTVVAGGLCFVVPLDHPWFKDVELLWKNEKGSMMTSVRFNPPPFAEQFANQTEIRDCLERRFGRAKDAEINHLTNDHSYQFQKYWPHASAYVGRTYMWLEFENGSRTYPVNFKAVVEALAACTTPG